MNKTFYITTPIFYPTGVPHIGTAYNAFIADTLARYYRQQLGRENVFFITGTDEHGANIAKKAEEAGETPKEYVDRYAEIFKDVWKSTNVSYDYFNRTTHPEHEKFAQELIQKSFDAGDIYEGEYEGWYCESCEAYYTEADLVDGKCPNHPTKTPVFTKEKNYYFKLSKYQDWLLKYIEEHPDFIQPVKWKQYVIDLVKQGLKDIPVTRANVKWGITVPFDKEQTIYVWYDALPNYLSVLHYAEFAKQNYYDKFWPEVTHVVGKDIVKFHTILWPAMLESAGYPQPQHVVVQGFFTVNGQKIGKSNNNAIDPRELAAKYGNEPVKYALLSEFQVGNDGDFSEERLKVKYNSELGNNWGNLLNRVIHLSNVKEVHYEEAKVSPDFKTEVDSKAEKYHQHIQHFEIFEAIQIVGELASFGNKYVDDHKPWEAEAKDVPAVLNNLQYLLRTINGLYSPILPESAAKAAEALEKREKIILFPKLD